MEQCEICCENFTEKLRKAVTCPYCPKKQCVLCVKQYLLTTSDDPHCMHCRTVWNPEFIDETLSRHWRLGEYKKHRGSILVSREKGNLIHFQECASFKTRRDEVEQAMKGIQEKMSRLKQERLRLSGQRMNIDYVLRGELPPSQLDKHGNRLHEDQARAQPQERVKFTMPCPGEDCRGLLNQAYHCTLCEKWCCKDCLKMRNKKEDQHECKKEDQETVALIMRTSKPCPKCHMRIQKTDGCDQMWCTQCHTTFSWRTGAEIVGGVVHNPHFYDWIRRNGGQVPRNPLDVPCGEANPNAVPHFGLMIQAFRVHHTSDKRNQFRDCHRLLSELAENQRIWERVRTRVNNIDLGVKFIMNTLSEEAWKLELEKRERHRMFQHDIHQIYGTLLQVGIQKLREFINHPDQCDQILKDLNAIREFTIEAFERVGKRFNWSVPTIKGWRNVKGRGKWF